MIRPNQCMLNHRAVSLLLVLSLLLITSISAQAQEEAVADYALIVDTSGSMIGLPRGSGNKDIFGDLKIVINEFIEELPTGSNILIIPFADGVDPLKIVQVRGLKQQDKIALTRHVNDLRADGAQTRIWDALAVAIEKMRDLAASDSRTHEQMILLYTDGQDTGSRSDPQEVLGSLDLLRGESGYVYIIYTVFGDDEVPDQLEQSELVTVLREDTPKPIQHVKVSPSALDFGNMRSETLGDRTLVLWRSTATVPTGTLNIGPVAVDGLPSGTVIDVLPRTADLGNLRVELRLSLVNFTEEVRRSVEGRSLEGTIGLSSSAVTFPVYPQSIGFTVRFDAEPPTPPPPPPTATPRPALVQIDAEPPESLGELDLRTMARLSGKMPIRASLNDIATDRGSFVRIRVLEDDDNATRLPERAVGLAYGDTGARVRELTLTAEDPEALLLWDLERADFRGLRTTSTGAVKYAYLVHVYVEPSDSVDIVKWPDAIGEGSGQHEMVFSWQVVIPSPWPRVLSTGAALFVLVFALSSPLLYCRFWKGHFDSRLYLTVDNGPKIFLRKKQPIRRCREHLLVGRREDDINLGLARAVIRITATRRGTAFLTPLEGNIVVNGEEVQKGIVTTLSGTDNVHVEGHVLSLRMAARQTKVRRHRRR